MPVLAFCVLAVVLAGSMLLLVRKRFVYREWLTIGIRIMGTLLILPLIAATLIAVLLAFRSRPKVFISRDGQHVAAYSYQPGFLGRDVTTVTVRNRWGLFTSEAYSCLGASEWTQTAVRWLDDDHIEIRYFSDQQHFQKCKPQADGIEVSCVALKR
jgi:hypothetical protein